LEKIPGFWKKISQWNKISGFWHKFPGFWKNSLPFGKKNPWGC